MVRAYVMLALVACSSPQLKAHVTELSKLVPATLEAERPREGDPRTVKLRVWVDAGVRANPRWRDEINEQVDYASQLLTPLLGARLTIETTKEWNREGDPRQALQMLTELDKGDDV